MLLTGIDIIEIDRVQETIQRWGTRFLHRIYTADELIYCRDKVERLAARFAAKEAAMKALGTGIRGVRWKDFEILRLPGQAPTITLHGNAKIIADKLGIQELAISISHSRNYAVALVIAWSQDKN